MLFEEIAKFSGIPTILTGDFNATVDSPVYQEIKSAGYIDSCHGATLEAPTYHGLMGTTGEPSHIDFIFHNSHNNDAAYGAYYLSDLYYRICNERVDNENVSDHYPILTVLYFSPTEK